MKKGKVVSIIWVLYEHILGLSKRKNTNEVNDDEVFHFFKYSFNKSYIVTNAFIDLQEISQSNPEQYRNDCIYSSDPDINWALNFNLLLFILLKIDNF